MTDEQRAAAEAALQAHAEAFLQSGLRAGSGYFPNDYYGKEAERYCRWANKAFDLIRALRPDERSEPEVPR